ncbi:hypothetical protein [Sphingomonas abaci]|uniref:Uncharacterized protein n=1 Tax=Sphingomonas abaci TaxID=237611 RepID=A0A7W7AGL1_9SPHN|nr:hypothetical protein [Sphingomonas abaci]MBB4616688.1 hypothetical protein [Sphingomonas abaci]
MFPRPVAARLLSLALVALAPASPVLAETAPFDLQGPVLKVTVTRGGVTLPIAQVPDLAAGDTLHIAAALPGDQSTHYLLVGGFLRGATNPPPKAWFTSAETWKNKRDTLTLTVPKGARQALVFLAPRTGGDFATLTGAVRGRPGAFVRAVQDLNQAALDRSRLDAFLAGIRRGDAVGPDRLSTVSPLLARSLAIKFDSGCLLKQPDLQAACLTQGRDSLVLADGHSASLAETLSGTPTDLALQVAATPQGGYGYYSPYIGVVRDVARILGAFQTAQFQYIPALGLYQDDRIALLLNAVPSFAKPQSVMVAALPPIETPLPPPLRLADPGATLCAGRPGLLLPVEGAPLIYSTGYARNMALRLKDRSGRDLEIPVAADPEQGGYVVAGTGLATADLAAASEGVLHGVWGFTPFDGPRVRLVKAGAAWGIAQDGSAVVGRDNAITLTGGASPCVADVSVRLPSGATRTLAWDAAGTDRLTVKLPLAGVDPGALTLLVRHYGEAEPQRLAVQALAEAGRVDGFTLHAGDRTGVLSGTRLDMVATLDLGGTIFRPAGLRRVGDGDQLDLATDTAPSLTEGAARTARVRLVDGRTLTTRATVTAARPAYMVIARNAERTGPAAPVPLLLAGADAVAQDARLTVSLRAEGAAGFAGTETIELVTAQARPPVRLDAANGGLSLQSDRVAIVTLHPGALLGPTAYGPLRLRVVRDGVASDWLPVGTLVRLPVLTGFTCAADGPCRLSGRDLYLAASVQSGSASVPVPDGFTGSAIEVPPPGDGTLVVQLRDAPDQRATATVPTGPDRPTRPAAPG